MKQRTLFFRLCILACMGFICTQSRGEVLLADTASREAEHNRFDYVKALDVLAAAIRDVRLYYVDTVSVERMYKTGLDVMLGSLDPYTEYYSEEDAESLKLMTSGEYGGIGAIIMPRKDSTVMVAMPMEGQPADKAGLRAGDVFLKIDGNDFSRTTNEAVSKALKGIAGSEIALLIRRPGVPKPIPFRFKRRKIQVMPVPYYGVLPGTKTGYIRLITFNDKTGLQFRTALEELKGKGISRLIIDERGNGGGLMGEAVKVVSCFVPVGCEVTRLKGRNGVSMAVYRTEAKPVDTDIPIAVLVDGETASSAEVVAGALQDLDRAVIIGSKTYGKGLVQSVRPLPYGGSVKLTTAKYYTPCGRCVQRIDYGEARKRGRIVITPDSLQHEFRTRGGRPVRDAGGILPDVTAVRDTLPAIVYYMAVSMPVFDYITDYCHRNTKIADPTNFRLADADYAKLVARLKQEKFSYDRKSIELLEALKKTARLEGFMPEADTAITALEKVLEPNLERDMQRFRTEIEEYVGGQIVRRYGYERGGIQYDLKHDQVLRLALDILEDSKRYADILAPRTTKSLNDRP